MKERRKEENVEKKATHHFRFDDTIALAGLGLHIALPLPKVAQLGCLQGLLNTAKKRKEKKNKLSAKRLVIGEVE